MKNKKGYTLIELFIVLAILGIATLVVVLMTAPKFDDKKEEAYQESVNLILKKAKDYGISIKDDIKDSSNGITITVSKLVELQYLLADESGHISDPRNEKQTLNDLKINIKYNESDDSVSAEVVS